jgi:hypothetical protein
VAQVDHETADGMRHRFGPLHPCGWALLAAAVSSLPAQAFVVAINPGNPRAIYLQVGVGSFTGGNYNVGGQPQNNSTVNTVSVSVPTAAVGSGTAQGMTSNTGGTNSFYDGFAFCNAGQLYVGGFYRFTSNSSGAAATLTANSSTPLNNGAGNTLSFTQITWVSSGNGDSGAQPFPSGTFNGTGSQSIGSIARNRWAESCMTFSYLNTLIPAAGIYTGTVTYTLTAP